VALNIHLNHALDDLNNARYTNADDKLTLIASAEVNVAKAKLQVLEEIEAARKSSP
jgi:hypothetical protein